MTQKKRCRCEVSIYTESALYIYNVRKEDGFIVLKSLTLKKICYALTSGKMTLSYIEAVNESVNSK